MAEYEKVKTKEVLIERLSVYERLFTSSIIEYLESLINLEFSIVRDYICDSERKILSQTEIYRDVAIYNIYNRAY